MWRPEEKPLQKEWARQWPKYKQHQLIRLAHRSQNKYYIQTGNCCNKETSLFTGLQHIRAHTKSSCDGRTFNAASRI